MSAMERMFNAPLPEKTDRYTPISHVVIDQNTKDILSREGFKVSKTHYRSSGDGMIGQAEYHINYGDDPEMGLMVAWQNSYNKLISFKYAVGAHVFVCSNGAVAGDIGGFRRKHTGTADQEAISTIVNYLGQAKDIFNKLVQDREHLKKIDLNATRMAELMGKMFIEKDIITSTQINIMKRELQSPTYDYGVPVHNAWSLYNFATHAFKEDSPRNWITRHIDLHNFFSDEFGMPKSTPVMVEAPVIITPEKKEIIEPAPKPKLVDLLNEF